MAGANSIPAKPMRGMPPFQLSCGQCGEMIGPSIYPSAAMVSHHYQIAHGWRNVPGRVLPIGFHRVRFRRLRRWLRQYIGLVG